MFKRGWVKHPLGLSRKVFPTKQVVNKTTNVVYASAQEAAKDTGVSVDAIYKCCSGKSKTAGKFQWEYCA